jgi:hypothetical protein
MLTVNAASGFGAGSAAVPYASDAVLFDGTNDYLSRGADLTGMANGKLGTLSVWLDFAGGDGVEIRFLNSNTDFNCWKLTTNKLQIVGQDASGYVDFRSTTSFVAASGWQHLLTSWDVGNSAGHLYLNGVDDLNQVTNADGTIDYTGTDWTIGSGPGGAGKANVNMADMCFDPTYIDLSVAGNRAKFIDGSSKPVDLGADGSTPTGSQPILFHHIDVDAAASTFATNLGTGGGFTENGSLTVSSTSPTD